MGEGKLIKLFISIVLAMIHVAGCKSKNDLSSVYDDYHVTGSIAIYDVRNSKLIQVNEPRNSKKFLPASTFKIPNSIIALEEKIIPDENFVIKWDGQKRKIPEWNRDHNLRSAFKFSVVWYYQDLARKIGKERYRKYLAAFQYGNGDFSEAVDMFWLQGKFRITPLEQINFLRKMYEESLPVSPRTYAKLKSIMEYKKTPQYTIRSKTGLTIQNGKTIGWWVGYIEKADKRAYLFANNIEKEDPDETFPKARIETAESIFINLGIL